MNELVIPKEIFQLGSKGSKPKGFEMRTNKFGSINLTIKPMVFFFFQHWNSLL
jgi:hypothetical protein